MSINKSYFEKFIKDNNEFLSYQRINKIIQVTKFDYYFFLIPSRKIMHISFNGNNPFIILENEFNYTKLQSTSNLQNLKKHLDDAKILEVEQLNDDKILSFKFKKTYDNYEVNNGQMIIEFMTNHPNLIILNSDNKVIYALHYTTIESSRLISLNIDYEFPKKGEKSSITHDDSLDLETIKKYNENIINSIKKDQFSQVIKKVNSSIKSLKRRINVLNELINDSSRFEDYKEAGDYVYSHLGEDFASFKINSKEFDMNPLLTQVENANFFYKKYKKFKEGNKINIEFLKKAEDELTYFENLKFQIDNCSIDDMEEISEELQQKGLIRPNFKTKKKIKSVMPYFVEYQGTKIYFGKNNMQNEILTFSLAKKDYYYLHVKDYHGSHVVIFNNNPNKEIIQKACEMALFLSKLQSGEIYIADIKDAKKGNVKGLAYLSKYQTIYISSYNQDEVKTLIESCKR